MADDTNFDHFLRAQAPVYATVLEELRQGRKRSHWMWFIFPQIAGLGHSAMARKFALSSLNEAKGYLAHDILGVRLRECTDAVLGQASGPGPHPSAHEIFGAPDDLKFRSAMTLFHRAAPQDKRFEEALRLFYDGEEDQKTIARLQP